MTLPVAMAIALVMAPTMDGAAQEAASPTGQITVRGEARVTAVPDMGEVSLAVVREADNAGDALAGASSAAADVLAAMAELGVEPRDVQTSEVSLSPIYEAEASRDVREIVGYRARNALTVRVRDLALLGDVIDRSVTMGANEGGGLRLSVSNEDELRDEARVEAVRNARDKAADMAAAAGVTLGALLTLSEEGTIAPPPVLQSRMMAAESVPIAAGETGIEASVTAVYAISTP